MRLEEATEREWHEQLSATYDLVDPWYGGAIAPANPIVLAPLNAAPPAIQAPSQPAIVNQPVHPVHRRRRDRRVRASSDERAGDRQAPVNTRSRSFVQADNLTLPTQPARRLGLNIFWKF